MNHSAASTILANQHRSRLMSQAERQRSARRTTTAHTGVGRAQAVGVVAAANSWRASLRRLRPFTITSQIRNGNA